MNHLRMKLLIPILVLVLIFFSTDISTFATKEIKNLFQSGVLDLNVLRCFLRNKNLCPSPYVTFTLHTPKSVHHGTVIKIHNPLSLYQGNFSKDRETVFIIHGFNGTGIDKHVHYLRDAYLSRDFNVIVVDWRPLTIYPCYVHALINTRLTAQCTAQRTIGQVNWPDKLWIYVYAFLNHHGAERESITCVGHSLGAHICGMISNHLTVKQYRIIGLDPARPLIERKKSNVFRLTIDDASVIQVIHTNAGFLGQQENTGHLNYCVNGGRVQPYCKGNPIRRSRCSHFLSICYLANAIFKHKKFLGVPCPSGCMDISGPKRLPVTGKNPFKIVQSISLFQIGNDAPDDGHGCYCIDIPFAKHCPFNDT